MQIVMLTTDFAPSIGGIASHVAGLARALSRRGHKVLVVVPRPVRLRWPVRARAEITQSFRVVRLSIPIVPKLGKLTYAKLVRKWLEEQVSAEWGVLHWHTFDSRIVSRINRIAKVFTNHTSQFLELAGDASKESEARKLVEPADSVITTSRQLAEATISLGYPQERVYFVPNGVDTQCFTPSVNGRSLRARYHVSDDECVVLCPARLEKVKGVIYWVDAISTVLRLSRSVVRFMFVGDYEFGGKYSARREVLSAIDRLGLDEKIIFAGSVPNEDMAAYFSASDVVVLPSLMEATSIAGLEAMACGKPVVGTRVGGIPDIVRDGETGLLVPPRDPEALAEAVVELVRSPEMRRRMGEAARHRAVQEFDWSRIAVLTETVYEKLLRPGDPRVH